MRQFIAPFSAVLAFLITFLSAFYFYSLTKAIYIEKDRYRALKELSDIRGKLENSISSTSLLIRGLVVYVKINPNLTQQEFERFAHKLIVQSKHIRNITLAPNNIIQYVHPLKGNEATLGLNLVHHPVQKFTVEKMMKEQKTIIAGPVNLIQGGKALINRTPIFIDDVYWGLASIPISMDSIFQAAQLQTTHKDLDFALRGADGLGKDGAVFFGDAALFEKNDVQILDVLLVNGSWQLAVAFNEQYKNPNVNWILYLGFIVACIVAILVFYFFFSRAVMAATNKKLKNYLDIIDETVIISSTDLKGKIVYASKALCQISGYSQEELLNKSHSILRDKEVSKSLYKELWETIKKNKTWEGEIKNRRKDGTAYWVKAKISPVFDEFGDKVGYNSIRQDISDKKIIEQISITDGLTHIFNRRYFNDIFPKIINSSKRNNDIIGFILLDIDHFKQYNDNYGHQKGDEVLIAFAQCLKKSLHRADDLVFRLGGEEFGVVFKLKDKEKALLFANSIKNSIESLKIKHEYSDTSEYLTASMGLVCENANDIHTMDELYKQADDLLYKAKKNGRNQVVTA
jgi:diguanylate cyclase (GGDEF)-like protein/PAS domain S-box-containing protein